MCRVCLGQFTTPAMKLLRSHSQNTCAITRRLRFRTRKQIPADTPCRKYVNSATQVSLCNLDVQKCLQSHCYRPYKVLKRPSSIFIVNVNSRSDTIAFECLKFASFEETMPLVSPSGDETDAILLLFGTLPSYAALRIY